MGTRWHVFEGEGLELLHFIDVFVDASGGAGFRVGLREAVLLVLKLALD